LIVANIENVVAGHIHGAPGVMRRLCDALQRWCAGRRVDGVIATATKTALTPACLWLDDLADVAAAMRGNTYVNVHTNDGNTHRTKAQAISPGGDPRRVREAEPVNVIPDFQK
jgi:hypothetical protein